ncbi:MAG: polyprenyl synthetase family protein [Planctomycetes bacterium]|nr:polyprenyl synthetase family protein [Planctomycetota bacterium]
MNVQLLDKFSPPLGNWYAPIQDDLERTKKIFDDELISDLPLVNEFCQRVRAYRGKMLRPALLLLSGKACGELTPAHHTLAAVVEMVHIATLVHDDVLDEADERRGRPTICSTDGNVAAVLLGDCLISHAFHLCSSLESQFASRRVGAATNTVCEGELLQNHLRGRDTVDETTYFEIVRRKTGALTAVACELGSHYAGASPEVVRATASFGTSAGVAFQIIDDVLDVTGERETIGKTLGLDLALGKLTLPTIHCLAHADAQTASALREVLGGRRTFTREEIGGWLDATNSIDYARSVAAQHVERALGHLESIPPGDAKDSLTAMARFIIDRRF